MIDATISKLESETGENMMVTEIIGPKQIAERTRADGIKEVVLSHAHALSLIAVGEVV